MMKPFAAWALVKSHESGWRRCFSDTVVGATGPDQEVTNRQRHVIGQPTEWDRCILSAGRVDNEGSEFELALERPLQHVCVLDPRSRHKRFRPPEDAASDGQSVLVDSISGPPVSSLGPDIARNCGREREHDPADDKTEPEAVTPRRRNHRDNQANKCWKRDSDRENASRDPRRGNRTWIERLIPV